MPVSVDAKRNAAKTKRASSTVATPDPRRPRRATRPVDVTFDQIGAYTYSVESFTDHFGTWADGLRRKAGVRDVTSELLEGEAMLREAAKRAKGKDRAVLLNAALVLADKFAPQAERAKA